MGQIVDRLQGKPGPMTDTAPADRPFGAFTAALSPMTADGAPDIARLLGHIDWLLANGSDGVAIMGTTGEANSLTVDQRLEIFAAVAPHVPVEKLMLGTGCCARPDTLRLTRAALDLGCPNVLMLPTFYYKNQSDDSVYGTFADIVERVGDPRLRIYMYHFPQMSATPINIPVVERLIRDYPTAIAGLKDSSGDFENYTKVILRNFPGFGAFSGTERYLLADLQAGGPGCISATANTTGPLAGEVMRRWRAGDADGAAEAQETLTAARLALQAFTPAIPVLKALAADRTGDAAWDNMLPPFWPLPEEERAEVKAAMRSFGLAGDIADAAE